MPRFSVPIWTSRKSAVAVFYAQSVLRAFINLETGAAIDKPEAAVSYAGAFLKRYPPSGDRRFKRIGAVMTIEEDGETRQSRILPRCSVIHRAVSCTILMLLYPSLPACGAPGRSSSTPRRSCGGLTAHPSCRGAGITRNFPGSI